MAGLIRACEKTPVTTIQIDNIISKVEKDLYSMGESEVRSRQVGELLMEKLATVNEVAYVRFASVYRRFKDIASFEKELSQIRSLKNEKIT
jgi:transcriptional repressor NrdR